MEEKLDRLHSLLRDMGSVVVAFSGGVDSAFVLQVAHSELGSAAVAVTADSPSLPRDELQAAKALAAEIGARHVCVPIAEMGDTRYVANSPERCYFCKTHTYVALAAFAEKEGFRHIVDGNNADDLRDVRPGRRAAQERGVRSPLSEAGLTKAEIREFARQAGLPVWDKPAAACLSSRIPFGTPITLESLSQVERAERYIKSLGVRQVRVRHLGADARIEVEPGDMSFVRARRTSILAQLNTLGFARVSLNLDGYQMGSLNRHATPRVEWL